MALVVGIYGLLEGGGFILLCIKHFICLQVKCQGFSSARLQPECPGFYQVAPAKCGKFPAFSPGTCLRRVSAALMFSSSRVSKHTSTESFISLILLDETFREPGVLQIWLLQ
jgi:hypothetical protein